MRILAVLLLVPLMTVPAFAETLPTDIGSLDVEFTTTPEDFAAGEEIRMNLNFINPVTQTTQIHIDYYVTVLEDGKEIFGPTNRLHTATGEISIPIQFQRDGQYEVRAEVDGILWNNMPTETVSFSVAVGQESDGAVPPETNGDDNGCLIATAAYGSELSDEVQMLREIRDNSLLATDSGSAFMAGFNQMYYSFSPAIADLERQSPAFRELVRAAITPLLASLSILNHVSMDSEGEVLGYGIGVIVLNLGMYIVLPLAGVLKLCQVRKNRTGLP